MKRQILAGPSGDLTDPHVVPVEALVEVATLYPNQPPIPMFMMKIALEKGDLDALKENGYFYVTMCGHVVPFQFHSPNEVNFTPVEGGNNGG